MSSNLSSIQVTVIIPNYNHARYLSIRLDSIIGQVYQNLDIILLDDCSSDDSREILKDYAARDPRIRLVFNEQNSGSTFKQWNKGIALAKGEYIWIAESDDVADPTFLEKLTAVLDANPAAGLAYCDSWRIDEQGERHGTWAPVLAELDANLWQHNFVLPGTELVRRFMAYTNIIPNASAVLMRRSALEKMGPAPETMRVAGDWVFWVRYLLSTQLAYVAEPLNYFRFHSNNVRSRTEQDGTQLVEMAQVLQLVKQAVVPEPTLYRKAVGRMMERWLHGLVYYQAMPLGRHRQFVRLMAEVEPGFRQQLTRQFLRFLLRNRLSGTRMLLGDRLLGRARKKASSS